MSLPKSFGGLINRGAYDNLRWLISGIKESGWKQALAVVVKIHSSFTGFNSDHFNTSQRGTYIRWGLIIRVFVCVFQVDGPKCGEGGGGGGLKHGMLLSSSLQ